MTDDLNRAINLIYEETGLVPEVDSAEELASALLEWSSALALENEHLRTELATLKSESLRIAAEIKPSFNRDPAGSA